MDITGRTTGSPLTRDDIDQQFELLLKKIKELEEDPTQKVSPETVGPVVDLISQGRHQTRISLSRVIEEFLTSWRLEDSISRLRWTILAALGLQFSTTERGVKAITRQLDDYLRSRPKGVALADLLSIVDAVATFYREYPNDFEFKYVEELFRFSEPSCFEISCSLATLMLGVNKNSPGRLRLPDVVDTLFATDDISEISEAQKIKAISGVIHGMPTKYWSQNLYRLDGTKNLAPEAQKRRLEFLRYFLLSDPPLLAIFSVEDVTYIVRPSDLLRGYEEGQSVREAIKACAERLREPMQHGNYLNLDSQYQDLLDLAIERSHAWQRQSLTADVIPLADYLSSREEDS